MRFHVVSDVHGATDDLAKAAAGADVFVCLGDLLLYLDYDAPAEGAFAEVFGAEIATEYIRLRTAKRFAEARALTAKAWDERTNGADESQRRDIFVAIIERQYAELFAAMPEPAVLTYGNVDVPIFWKKYLKPGHRVLDGEITEIDGVRIGMVGGGLKSPYTTPNEITAEEYAEKVARLEPVDVLFTHIPPAVPELTFDVVARRFEVGSVALREYILDTQPQFALFGHVHQPLAARMRLGRTECLNVGHFRSRRTPFVLDV